MMSTNPPEGSAAAPGAPEEVWAVLQRTSDLMAESEARMADSDARMAELRESMKETDRRIKQQMQETDRRIKRRIKQQAKEADRRMKETDRQMQETDRRLRKAEGLFTSQWGKLMESLVEGDLVPLLKERGIAVEGTSQRFTRKRNGEHFEIDILAVNGAQVVVVEVKTTLRPRDVARFLDKLSHFADWFPEYRERRIYGAVAYLKSDSSVRIQAERRGLFVIRATGNSASIVNKPDFEPRVFP